MHSSTFITLLSASLAVASPVHNIFHKKAIVTDIVTDIVLVTVTATGEPQPTAPVVAAQKQQGGVTHTHTHHVTVTAGGPPPPSSQAPAPSVVIVTESAAPAPVSSAAPVVVQEAPSSAAPVVVAPVSSAAPVVVKPVASSAAPATTAAAAPASAPTDYASTAVFNHNQHRANHSASAFAWNQTLADWAAKTASSCVFAHDMTEGTQNYGQNIAAYGISSGVPDLTKVLANAISEMWYYGEVGAFPFGEPAPVESGSVQWLHFSQAVWKDTKTVGCATQKCAGGTVLGGSYESTYTVCNYFPAGNMMGEFNTEVTPSTDSVGTLAAPI